MLVGPRGHATNRNQNAVQAFYFVNRFHDHLAAPFALPTTFEGVDRLLSRPATARTAAHGNNAFMYTPPDGRSPTMQMQLWNRDGRTTNAGDDASIVYHEYTHGLSGRLVTDAAGAGALNSPQAGAMGEGWSDWYAKDFLAGPRADTAASGEIHMGEYAGREHPQAGARLRRRRAGRDLPGAGRRRIGRRRRLHVRRLREDLVRRARDPRRRRDLGADAVGPAGARSARPRRGA